MGEPSDPPEGAPGGGEDEYRSVVFDESFVRAARLQEFSAQERITDHAPAVRRREPVRRGGGLSRQVLVLVLLIAVAFGTAVYMGVRHPYRTSAADRPAEPLRMTVVPSPRRTRCPAPPTSGSCTRTARPRGSGSAPRGSPSRRPGAPRTSPTTRWCPPCSPRRTTSYGPRWTRPCSPAGRPGTCGCCSTPASSSSSTTASTGPPPTDGTRSPDGWSASTPPGWSWPTSGSGCAGPCRPPRPTARPWRSPPTTPSSTRCVRPARGGTPRRRCSRSAASCASASTGTTCGCTRRS